MAVLSPNSNYNIRDTAHTKIEKLFDWLRQMEAEKVKRKLLS